MIKHATLYIGLLILLFIYISYEAIMARRKNKISLGYGRNFEIAGIISAHSNFNDYTPIFLISLVGLELLNKFPYQIIHCCGVIFLLGRLLHFVAFRKKMNFKFRVLGMVLTLTALLATSVLLIVGFFI